MRLEEILQKDYILCDCGHNIDSNERFFLAGGLKICRSCVVNMASELFPYLVSDNIKDSFKYMESE